MVRTINQPETIQTLKNKIYTMYEYLIEQKDVYQAEKIKQLAIKTENQEFVIAFCGHFSAGKSTMINRVIGESLLPSSPIPTSANLVKVKSGEDYAKVYFKDGNPRLYLAPYDYELVKNYCKDGDQIEEIEISNSQSALPENTVIMDTPGIDSADDAHRIATESALHLADLIFYVMDYNHVQSELNFLFTKELTEAGKEVYLVINQIDKHKDEELRFQDFQKSVTDAFSSWGVRPARIFYTSLKNPGHRYNEFNELQKFISDKLVSKNRLFIPSVLQSLKKIAYDHLEQIRKAKEDELQPIAEPLNQLTETEKMEILEEYQELHTSLQTIAEGIKRTEQDFDSEIALILKNAYLMPASTRELAESFLQSEQSDFKVGFLFAKQKTQDEKEARLVAFYKDILEKTKSQLEWHLREYLLRVLKENSLDEKELTGKAQSFSIGFDRELLISTVKPGARVSGDYVLHYTEDLANEIKKIARNEISRFKDDFLHLLTEKTAELKERNEKKYNEMKRYTEALHLVKEVENKMLLTKQEIEEILTHVETGFHNHDKTDLFKESVEEVEIVRGDVQGTKPVTRLAERYVSEQAPVEPIQHDNGNVEKSHLQQTVRRLRESSALVKELPGFQKLSKELAEKAVRLEDKGFTVALFGAFSAGKSSFANALIGEKILPVSPNPTTAAINKIKPVTEENPHGTVLVKFKDPGVMLEDVNRSLKVFNLEAENFTDALKMAEQFFARHNEESVLEKTHIAFLKAFTKGFEPFVNHLGNVMESDITEFGDFVAKEERSCFIEWIELYYDCELTKKGITLVDTPGADSINARHTGVAFDYIKNSDAILFVTYYNHAFSKADREFLIQLGRVKDSFQMDKMFFIINAIDLAENEEEKMTVAGYVNEQLNKYGIRNPHLFSLSSLLAINEKLEGRHFYSGMDRFEQAFYHFISNDLTEMALSSSNNELKRVYELVSKLIHNSREDESIKEKKRIDIENQKQLVNGVFGKQEEETLQNRIIQETEELVFYIKQRVFFRFSDFFKESFNPSTLRDDGRNLKKALENALDEFLGSFGYDFAQEMRATTVRLDRFTERILTDFQKTLMRRLTEINEDLTISEFEMNAEGKIEFPSAFTNIDRKIFSKAMGFFKNPKTFFEKDEKKLMSDELQNLLTSLADEYLSEQKGHLNNYYSHMVTKEYNRLIEQAAEQAEDFYLSLLLTLDGGVSIERLLEIQEKLQLVEGE